MYEKCAPGSCASGVQCGVLEWVKRNTLSWFGHIERMKSDDCEKGVHVSELEDYNQRGRPLGRWRDKVKEYMR